MAEDTTAEGIPLRDYFAGQCMAAAFERARTLTGGEYERVTKGRGGYSDAEVAAILAYQYADAMVDERKRRS
jgi:hypothetical protein